MDQEGTNVHVVVTYDLRFSTLERNLAELGLTFTDHAQLMGEDASERRSDELQVVGEGPIKVPPANFDHPVPRRYKGIFSRASLNEDPGVNRHGLIISDDDEIRCRIRVFPKNMPAITTEFTNEFVLVEQEVANPNP